MSDPKRTLAQACYKDIPTLMGFIITGAIWDALILSFAYMLFLGPT